MKLVTLYELKQTQVNAFDSQMDLTHTWFGMENLQRVEGSEEFIQGNTVTLTNIPIKRYCRVIDGETIERYIAIHPAVEDIFNCDKVMTDLKYNKLLKASLLTRIKWLFTGVKK